MNLIDALAKPTSKRASKGSVMDVWVRTRPEDEQAAILAAVVDPRWGHVQLHAELAQAGAPDMSDTAFRQWRRTLGWTA